MKKIDKIKAFRNYFILVCLIIGIIVILSYYWFILILKMFAADQYMQFIGGFHCWTECDYGWIFFHDKSILYTFFYFWWNLLVGILIACLGLFLYYKMLLKANVAINTIDYKVCGVKNRKVDILKKDICSIKLFKFFNTIFIITRKRMFIFPFIVDAENAYNDMKKQNVEQFDYKKASFVKKLSMIIIVTFQILCRIFIVISLAYLLFIIYLFFFTIFANLIYNL